GFGRRIRVRRAARAALSRARRARRRRKDARDRPSPTRKPETRLREQRNDTRRAVGSSAGCFTPEPALARRPLPHASERQISAHGRQLERLRVAGRLAPRRGASEPASAVWPRLSSRRLRFSGGHRSRWPRPFQTNSRSARTAIASAAASTTRTKATESSRPSVRTRALKAECRAELHPGHGPSASRRGASEPRFGGWSRLSSCLVAN